MIEDVKCCDLIVNNGQATSDGESWDSTTNFLASLNGTAIMLVLNLVLNLLLTLNSARDAADCVLQKTDQK